MADTAQIPSDLDFESIEVGVEISFPRVVTAEDVAAFARLSGDFNPLHVDPDYARRTRFGRCVVHGMFLAGLLSRLVGMHLPGKKCLYLSQTLDFVHPVFAGDDIRVEGSVLQKQESTRSLVIRTQIRNADDIVVLRGKAQVQVLALEP